MADEALESVIIRNEFYRDGYRKCLTAVLVLILANIIGLMSVFAMYTQRPETKFFATSPDGRIIPIVPLNQKGKSSAEILDWATKAAIKTYTYDYVNYRTSLQDVSELFTGDGWTQFQRALTSSRMLKTVIASKLVMTARPTGAPVVVEEGVRNNRYIWSIQIPMLVKLSGDKSLTKPVKVSMLVQRVSLVNNPEGIAIVNFVVSE